jgi:hypothetical protein
MNKRDIMLTKLSRILEAAAASERRLSSRFIDCLKTDITSFGLNLFAFLRKRVMISAPYSKNAISWVL